MSKPTSTETNTNSRDYADAADSLSAILKKELTQFSRKGYLDPSDPTVVTAADRKALVDWCYGVVDHYDLSRETVATAMEMVDRFLSISAGPFAIWDANSDVAKVGNNALHCQSEFQLLTVAALYSSLKAKDTLVSIDEVAEACGGIYTKEDIEYTEHTVQKGLSWQSIDTPPTAYRIGHSILSMLVSHLTLPEDMWGFLLEEMKYQTEIAVRDYYFSTLWPSTVALAATSNAIQSITSKAHEEMLNNCLSGILECIGYSQSIHMNAARSRLQLLLQGDDVVEAGTSPGISHDTKTSSADCEGTPALTPPELSIFSSDDLDPDLLEAVDVFMNSFDCENNPMASLPAPAVVATASTGSIPKKKPARPLPAYHMFLQLEREFIIQTIDGEDADKSIHDDKVYLDYVPERYRQIKLSPDWYHGPGKRKKRKHRKLHGKIGPTELTRTISSRWAELGETNPEVKRFVQNLAKQQLMEYQREMEEYEKLTSNLAFAPTSAKKNTSKRALEGDVENGIHSQTQKQRRLLPSVSVTCNDLTPRAAVVKACPKETVKSSMSTMSNDLKTFHYRPVQEIGNIRRRITLQDPKNDE